MVEKPVAITVGEPAGIGPDLCLDILSGDWTGNIVVIGDREVLAARARTLNMPFAVADYHAATVQHRAILHCPAAAAVVCGKLSAENAAHVLTQLKIAADGCLRGDFGAMVTAPVNKQIINVAGFNFCGQTEYIAEYVAAAHPVMLLSGGVMRVALATRHVPLAKVAAMLAESDLAATLRILDAGLKKYFTAGRAPRIVVAGLNPHAGEGGFLGDEESRIICPAIRRAQREGLHVEGPFAADSMYQLTDVDCFLAMYHDQGLPVIKYADFEQTINATLGLPFLRVSPDHGTAVSLAGRGIASTSSMRAAVRRAFLAR